MITDPMLAGLSICSVRRASCLELQYSIYCARGSYLSAYAAMFADLEDAEKAEGAVPQVVWVEPLWCCFQGFSVSVEHINHILRPHACVFQMINSFFLLSVGISCCAASDTGME